jgi:carboxyl-terminal processing protease
LLSFCLNGFFVQAQSDYACSTAKTLKSFLDETHAEPESLDGKWSEEVTKSFLLKLDPQGLLFTQQDFSDSLQQFNELESVIQEDACAFLSSVNEFLINRLNYVDTLLSVFRSQADLEKYEQGIERPANISGYATDMEILKDRWAAHLKMVYLKKVYLESTDEELASLDRSAAFTRLIEQEHCKLEKKRSLVDDDQNFVSKAFFDAMAMAYDPHTRYYRFRLMELLNIFFSENDESYGFKLEENEQGEIAVSKLLPGGPAWRSNQIHVGDVLIKMKLSDGTELDFNCIALNEVGRTISKDAAETAELTIMTATKEIKTIDLAKEKVELDENGVRGYVLNGEKKIGYISLPDFYTTDDGDDENERGCARDVARELIKLKREKIEGLIFDLRNNGGGSLGEAIELLGIFIEEGPLTLLQKKDKIRLIRDQNRGAIYLGPLVVLVNGQSASASELVASTLKDYNRALIVGDTTYGKAVGQEFIRIGSDSDEADSEDITSHLETALLKVTTSRLFRLKGDSYQGLGVVPHIYVPDLLDGEDDREALSPFSVTRQLVDRDTYFKKYPDFDLSGLRTKNQLRLNVSGFSSLKAITDSLQSGNAALGHGFLKEDFMHVRRLQQAKEAAMEQLLSTGFKPFEAQNHEFDKTLISIDPKKKDVEVMTLMNLQNNIYIRNAYSVINDLIKTTD